MNDSGILITVNLLGQLSPRVAHTTKEVVSVNITPIGSNKSKVITRKIAHTSRIPTPCTKEVQITPNILAYWESSNCPVWSNLSTWKKMNKKQRVESYVSRFDEGYGVKYE